MSLTTLYIVEDAGNNDFMLETKIQKLGYPNSLMIVDFWIDCFRSERRHKVWKLYSWKDDRRQG